MSDKPWRDSDPYDVKRRLGASFEEAHGLPAKRITERELLRRVCAELVGEPLDRSSQAYRYAKIAAEALGYEVVKERFEMPESTVFVSGTNCTGAALVVNGQRLVVGHVSVLGDEMLAALWEWWGARWRVRELVEDLELRGDSPASCKRVREALDGKS